MTNISTVEYKKANFALVELLFDEGWDPKDGEYSLRLLYSSDGVDLSLSHEIEDCNHCITEWVEANELGKSGPIMLLLKEHISYSGHKFDQWYEVEHACFDCSAISSVSVDC